MPEEDFEEIIEARLSEFVAGLSSSESNLLAGVSMAGKLVRRAFLAGFSEGMIVTNEVYRGGCE